MVGFIASSNWTPLAIRFAHRFAHLEELVEETTSYYQELKEDHQAPEAVKLKQHHTGELEEYNECELGFTQPHCRNLQSLHKQLLAD